MKTEREKIEKKPVQNGLFADNGALLAEGERADELQFKGLRLIQSPASFCFGTDSVLLTHFALNSVKNAKKGARFVDMGSGSGVISLLIAAKTGMDVTSVEIDAAQCERFSRTLELNGIAGGAIERGIGRIEIVCADYLDPELKSERKFDHAVCNPPYFRAGSGGRPLNEGATHEKCADIASIARAARGFLKFGADFFLCFPAERLAEAFAALSVNKLEPKALRLVRAKAGKRPYLALIRAKHGAKPGLIIEDELIVLDENGSYTPEVERYYHGE